MAEDFSQAGQTKATHRSAFYMPRHRDRFYAAFCHERTETGIVLEPSGLHRAVQISEQTCLQKSAKAGLSCMNRWRSGPLRHQIREFKNFKVPVKMVDIFSGIDITHAEYRS